MTAQSSVPQPASPFHERLTATSTAQSRYLFWLAIAGLFFYSLDLDISSSSAPARNVRAGVAGIEFAAPTIWAAGPSVLGFLLLAVLGATTALSKAAREMGHRGLPEHLDASFNIVDAVLYTTADSPGWLKTMVSFGYPAVLTLFWLEAAVLLIELFARPPGSLFPQIDYPFWQGVSAWLFRLAGSMLVIFALPRLLAFWGARVMSASRKAG